MTEPHSVTSSPLRERQRRIGVIVLALGLTACRPPPSPAAPASPRAPAATPSPPDLSILSAPDRSAEDRALDVGRRPAELLAFAGVRPGMRVAEVGAWKGYTTELLARAVAPDGTVYAVDPPEFDQETHATWEERAKRPTFARIVRLARSYADPFPEGTPPLDVVFVTLFYHDMVWLKVDRARMNAAMFRALKPGGALVITDHSARAGDGARMTQSLHRIEQSVVEAEVESAGFVKEGESGILRHPEDTRDWSASDEAPPDKRGKSDRFVLRFRKPG
jgi:predicted methyltransferase